MAERPSYQCAQDAQESLLRTEAAKAAKLANGNQAEYPNNLLFQLKDTEGAIHQYL